MKKIICLIFVAVLCMCCESEEKKNILRINSQYEKGWKLEYQSFNESPELKGIWHISDYFIDNQSSNTLFLEEVRYSTSFLFSGSTNNEIIQIKPGINYKLPVIRGMGDIFIFRKPPEKIHTYNTEEEISKWHLHY